MPRFEKKPSAKCVRAVAISTGMCYNSLLKNDFAFGARQKRFRVSRRGGKDSRMTYTKIAFITGPTAVGKTALSLSLAEAFSGEIISCDSMQLYRGMDIGTAKPTKEERARVKHHMIDILDIHDPFSVVEYAESAEQCIRNIYAREHLPFFCGGTGLYIDAVVHSTQFGSMQNLPEYREELKAFAAENGAEALHKKLAAVDPESAEKIDYRNVKRVIRALGVYKSSGMPISQWQKSSQLLPKKFDSLVLVLEYADREKLYERINRRVDVMMEQGLLTEVQSLYEKGLFDTMTAGQAIGYKEFRPYFEGTASLSDCVEALKTASRRYAKRQMTWFRREPSAKHILVDGKSADELFCEVSGLCREFFKPELIWSAP